VKAIGAGFGRTGTTSLKAALERLGFDPCYHMTEVFAHPAHADFWVAAALVLLLRRARIRDESPASP
jgi:Sulfotransferase domain